MFGHDFLYSKLFFMPVKQFMFLYLIICYLYSFTLSCLFHFNTISWQHQHFLMVGFMMPSGELVDWLSQIALVYSQKRQPLSIIFCGSVSNLNFSKHLICVGCHTNEIFLDKQTKHYFIIDGINCLILGDNLVRTFRCTIII